MDKPLKYAVFGAGSWATAIVKMLCENLDEVGWYMRSVYIKEHHPKRTAQSKLFKFCRVSFKTTQIKQRHQ